MKKSYLIYLSFFLYYSFAYSQQTDLWGVTTDGGALGGGTIYSVDSNGNSHDIEYNFTEYAAGYGCSGSFIKAQNGKYYGLNGWGGQYNGGTIFEYNPETKMIFDVYSFGGPGDGKWPIGGLIEGSNGKLYGMTQWGGIFGTFNGIIFEFDPVAKTYNKLHDFDDATTGSQPRGDLFQANNGKLYGMTCYGGLNNDGVVFEFDLLSDTFTKLFDFQDGLSGQNPYGGFIQAANGLMYGTTFSGNIFSFDINTNTFQNLFNKTSTSGNNPYSNLFEADNGKLYGLMSTEGSNNAGTLFEFNTLTNTYTKLHDFDPSVTGKTPKGTLKQAVNGKLYGATSEGGLYNQGALFEFSITGSTVAGLHHFQAGTFLGVMPSKSAFYETDDNVLMGITENGGIVSGVIYEFDINTSIFTKLHDLGVSNGHGPAQGLTEGNDGLFYGLTYLGGEFNDGVIFSYDPYSGDYIKRATFSPITGSGNPSSKLFLASNGKFYATTQDGGDFVMGTLFEFDPLTDTIIKLIDFDGTVKGDSPIGNLVQGQNGKLYGVTFQGGIDGGGVLFEYDPLTNLYSKKHDFVYGATVLPQGIYISSNGKIYGSTGWGGANDDGTIFEYDYYSNSFTTEFSFDNFFSTGSGKHPKGSLVEVSTGLMYGATSSHYLNNHGSIFQYDTITNTATTLAIFNGTALGSSPEGSLVQSPNGLLYGVTTLGGANNVGVLFEYNTGSGILTNKFNFSAVDGSSPSGTLIPYTLCIPQYNIIENVSICAGSNYTFPDGNSFNNIISDTSYVSYLQTITACDSTITTNVVVEFIDTSITKNYTTLTSDELLTDYQWLDCNNGFAPIAGETNMSMLLDTLGSFAVQLTLGGCVDTSLCYDITPQDFYDTPGYVTMFGEVFALPVTNSGLCDAELFADVWGGIFPYTLDWISQPNNQNASYIDSACDGIYTLKITDNIGDSLLVNYYVTDSTNFYYWYDTLTIIPSDTIFIADENCLLNYNVPLDSVEISQFYLIGPSLYPSADLYFMELIYYQGGLQYLSSDTVEIFSTNFNLIVFSVYCSTKSLLKIKTALFGFNHPDILGLNNWLPNEIVSIYPNPVGDELTLSFINQPENASVTIYDANGRLLTIIRNVSSAKLNINTSELEAGTYMVVIKDNDQVQIKKIVKL